MILMIGSTTLSKKETVYLFGEKTSIWKEGCCMVRYMSWSVSTKTILQKMRYAGCDLTTDNLVRMGGCGF